MFKVGDKVCDPVRYGNGIIEEMSGLGIYPVLVRFEDGDNAIYTKDGRFQVEHRLPSLYHGHMEEGTCKITFEPKKEPVYEWQWEYIATSYQTGLPKVYATSSFYKTEKDAIKMVLESSQRRFIKDVRDFIRIERSKRERKA